MGTSVHPRRRRQDPCRLRERLRCLLHLHPDAHRDIFQPDPGHGCSPVGRYTRVQKQGWLAVQIWVATSGYTAGTGTYEIDLPAGWTPVTAPRPHLAGMISLGGANPTAYTARVETSGTKIRLYRGDASAALAGATLTANSTIEVSGWMELA